LARRFVNDAANLQAPTFVWRYGSARVWKDEETGGVKMAGFAEFAHFEKRGNVYKWSPTAKYPDPKWQFCAWGNASGHPGEGDIASAAQWTAPFDAEIRISGELKRASERGDGIHGWIACSSGGNVFDAHVAPGGACEMRVATVVVKKGDIITFAVTSEQNTDSDGFSWSPVIQRLLPGGKTELLTDAKRDFCGQDHWPVSRTRPQSVIAQLAQVLLMSNEFQFVD
jgi:hypothetical protein